MKFVTPNSWGTLSEANDCHTPAGSPEGGQFCSKSRASDAPPTLAAEARGSRAATHIGECQVCGAQQALPRGVLAKHGYNVRWGFFSGICEGSGYKPFNTSTDRIEQAIESRLSQAASLRKFAAEARRPVAENATTAWILTSTYVGRDRLTRWEELPIHEETFGEGRYKKFLYDEPDFRGNPHRREINFPYPGPKTRAEAINLLNEKYAASLDGEASQIDGWISWQRARVKNWREKPLTPRAAPTAKPAGERTRVVTRGGREITLVKRGRRWVSLSPFAKAGDK